jgi:hypothetical protein
MAEDGDSVPHIGSFAYLSVAPVVGSMVRQRVPLNVSRAISGLAPVGANL